MLPGTSDNEAQIYISFISGINMLQGIKMLFRIRRICDMQTVTSNAGSQYFLQMGGQGHPMQIHSLLPPPLLLHIPKNHLKSRTSLGQI